MDNKNKVKLIKYFIVIFSPILCIIIFGIYKETICKSKKCDNHKVKNGEYCFEHTCEWEGCTLPKGIDHINYCYYHSEQNNLNNNKTEEIKLTEFEVNKAKQVINEYCNNLINQQKSILAINLINDYPEDVFYYSCSFRCNVVRTDSKINWATIYLSIDSNRNFKVDKLLYD